MNFVYVVGFINARLSLILASYVPTTKSPGFASQGPIFTEKPSDDSAIHPSAVFATTLTLSVTKSGETYHVKYPYNETPTTVMIIVVRTVYFDFSNNIKIPKPLILTVFSHISYFQSSYFGYNSHVNYGYYS